jgi:CRISPR/Cas system-associated endoribonuclease Cas2
VPLGAEDVSTLVAKIEEVIDPASDSVYIYPVCERCRANALVCGQGTSFDEDYVWIV